MRRDNRTQQLPRDTQDMVAHKHCGTGVVALTDSSAVSQTCTPTSPTPTVNDVPIVGLFVHLKQKDRHTTFDETAAAPTSHPVQLHVHSAAARHNSFLPSFLPDSHTRASARTCTCNAQVTDTWSQPSPKLLHQNAHSAFSASPPAVSPSSVSMSSFSRPAGASQGGTCRSGAGCTYVFSGLPKLLGNGTTCLSYDGSSFGRLYGSREHCGTECGSS